MRATKYKERITVQTMTKVPNGIGGWSDTWADSFSTWAGVTPIKSLKALEYGRLGFVKYYTVEMRKRTVDETNRVVYNGENYQINSISVADNVTTLDIAK